MGLIAFPVVRIIFFEAPKGCVNLTAPGDFQEPGELFLPPPGGDGYGSGGGVYDLFWSQSS